MLKKSAYHSDDIMTFVRKLKWNKTEDKGQPHGDEHRKTCQPLKQLGNLHTFHTSLISFTHYMYGISVITLLLFLTQYHIVRQ